MQHSLHLDITDPVTGEVVPITLVTDNGGPFRSATFAALIENTPELERVTALLATAAGQRRGDWYAVIGRSDDGITRRWNAQAASTLGQTARTPILGTQTT